MLLTMSDRIATLVLAGGEGRRMGGAKPRRLLGGRRLLDFAMDVANASDGPVALGLRRKDQACAAGIACVLDDETIEGPLASLAAGLRWAVSLGAPRLQTLPCDAPFLPRDLTARMASRGDHVVIPMSNGQLHPSCGLWQVSVAEGLNSYLQSGRRALMGFAEHIGYVAEDWGASARDPFFNVNTPDDLARAAALMDQPHLE